MFISRLMFLSLIWSARHESANHEQVVSRYNHPCMSRLQKLAFGRHLFKVCLELRFAAVMWRNSQYTFTVFSLLAIQAVFSVDDKICKYIQNVIELHSSAQFSPNPLPLLRSCVPPDTVISPKESDAPFDKYPAVLIWQPEVQFHWIFPRGIQCCEQNCGGILKYSFWTDGSTERKNPRTIHHCGEICLLVARYYVCQKNAKHCFTGTHPSILGQFPDPALLPFVLLHKAGVTRDLLYHIPKLVNAGMSFLEIELFLSELRRELHFHRYLSEYPYSREPKLSSKNMAPEYVDISLSNDLLTHFYTFASTIVVIGGKNFSRHLAVTCK